jgi:ankyrin repeat protein
VTEDKKKSLPWYKQIELKQAEKEKKVCDAYGDLERDLYFLDMSAPDYKTRARELFAQGVNVDAGDPVTIHTGLHKAAMNGRLDLVKLFVEEFEATVDVFDRGHDTACAWAAFHGHVEVGVLLT